MGNSNYKVEKNQPQVLKGTHEECSEGWGEASNPEVHPWGLCAEAATQAFTPIHQERLQVTSDDIRPPSPPHTPAML